MTANASILQDVSSSGSALETVLRNQPWKQARVTLIGHGPMGQDYLKAFEALGIGHIRVCCRTEDSLKSLENRQIERVSGGFQALPKCSDEAELAVVATKI